MNKRQAKKAFKKKYGINPGEVEKMIGEINTNLNALIEQTAEEINTFLHNAPEILYKILEKEKEMTEQTDTEALEEYVTETTKRIETETTIIMECAALICEIDH